MLLTFAAFQVSLDQNDPLLKWHTLGCHALPSLVYNSQKATVQEIENSTEDGLYSHKHILQSRQDCKQDIAVYQGL